ncbi:MAG TPA: VOC family protein [Hyphomicrobiaceae bacterium]|nr:VOC family protein [Hyphomicrobiaceae bacterium]
MTSDLDAATAFYADVVGWKTRDYPQAKMRYVMGLAGETAVAGMMTIPDEADGMPPGWIGYIGVKGIDGACARLKSGGGVVHRPPDDIPGIGRFAMVSDNTGAMYALFTSDDAAMLEPQHGMTPGLVGWHELMSGDWEKSFAFYAEQYGWVKTDTLDMGPMGTYLLFGEKPAGNSVGGMMTMKEALQSFWLFYFVVEDIDAAMDRAVKKGAELMVGPMEVPGGAWIIQARDPQGAHFALVGMRKAEAPS